MKKTIIALCILLCVGFTLSAAVDIKADNLSVGAISSDAEIDGVSIVPGTGKAEVVAASDTSTGYSNVLTLSGDAAVSVPVLAGETISITGIASDDGSFNLMITSDSDVEEIVGGESSDNGTMLIVHPVEEDGDYMISSAYGDPVSLCEISIE